MRTIYWTTGRVSQQRQLNSVNAIIKTPGHPTPNLHIYNLSCLVIACMSAVSVCDVLLCRLISDHFISMHNNCVIVIN